MQHKFNIMHVSSKHIWDVLVIISFIILIINFPIFTCLIILLFFLKFYIIKKSSKTEASVPDIFFLDKEEYDRFNKPKKNA